MKSSDQTNNGRMQLCRTSPATAVEKSREIRIRLHGWERQPLARESRAGFNPPPVATAVTFEICSVKSALRLQTT